jgi:hypothetical protein
MIGQIMQELINENCIAITAVIFLGAGVYFQ